MAHYHFHAKVISRRDGRSAVAAAAYRAGEKLRNDHENCVADFSRRKGVLHTEILAPEGAADWVFDREALWNEAEASERRKDAQLAREVELALPHELDHEQRLTLLRTYVKKHFVDRGMVADIALHASHKEGDQRNVHAHVMLTMRKLLPRGLGPKVREWNNKANVKVWRREWARAQNASLVRAGHQASVDHRSYRAQGINKQPGIHEGPKTRRMRQRGYQPGSQVVTRTGWKGQRRTFDYRRLDQGRTRRQRNVQIAWTNRVRSTSSRRLAHLVESHVHRIQLQQTWQRTRDAGAKLREARGTAYRADWLAERAVQVRARHQQKLHNLARIATQLRHPSDALNAALLYRSARLARASARHISMQAKARRAHSQARRAATQYRNLRSRLGGQQAQAIQRRVSQRHEAALRAVSRQEIFASALPDTQRHDLVAAWRQVHRRGRGSRSDR